MSYRERERESESLVQRKLVVSFQPNEDKYNLVTSTKYKLEREHLAYDDSPMDKSTNTYASGEGSLIG